MKSPSNCGTSCRFWFGLRQFALPMLIGVFSTCAQALEPTPVVLLANLQPPFMDLQDEVPTGLVIDIAKTLFERAGVPYSFKFMPPKRAYMTAQEEKNHCVLDVERSQEREALFHWVSPLLVTRHAFYAHPDSGVSLRTLEDARPFIIGSYLGSGVGEYLENLGFNVDYAARNELNARKLEKKRIQLWASDTVSAGLLIQEHELAIDQPELVILTTLQAMACHRGMPRELIKHLQATLLAMYRDGSLQQLYAGYQKGAGMGLQ
jgi:polar amino acid transport system substrate-binding protein